MKKRLYGIDLARFIAFLGMVLVNFKMTMAHQFTFDPDHFLPFIGFFEGKAAALFVVLAGLSLGLAFKNKPRDNFHISLFKRAVVLFGLGMLNMLIFPADIIHYYAFYFALAPLFFGLSRTHLIYAASALIIAQPIAMMLFNYDQGWNWLTYTYTDLWHFGGFARNLVFNGWHPLLPWLSFFICGLFLSHFDLAHRNVKKGLIIGGILGMISAYIIHDICMDIFASEADLQLLFGLSPIPPGPIYMVLGLSGAALIIGLCLFIPFPKNKAYIQTLLAQTGQQSLSLYFAHIMLGMGALEFFGMSANQDGAAILTATLIFALLCVLYTWLWRKKFTSGPLESLMRILTRA